MDNKIETTENTEEVVDTMADSSVANDTPHKSKLISTMPAPSAESEPVVAEELSEESSADSENIPETEDGIQEEELFEEAMESEDSVGDTIVIPKHIVDEETVEQLVENRTPKTVSGAKKKKKKKNHYALKTLIVLLAFVLVFAISFFVARMLFSIDDRNTATEPQKATDITEKTTDDTDTGDKVIIEQPSDSVEEDGEQATEINTDDDIDEPAPSRNNNNNNNNNSNNNNNNNNNRNTGTTNSGNNSTNRSETEDDGDIILPGTPSSDESTEGTAGIELE